MILHGHFKVLTRWLAGWGGTRKEWRGTDTKGGGLMRGRVEGEGRHMGRARRDLGNRESWGNG